MDQGQQAGDAPELATGSDAGEQPDNTADDLQHDDADSGDEALLEAGEQTEEDDTEEVEHEGKKARVPKEWKDALLRQADYTQKTQALAEARRTFETQREQIAQALHIQHQLAGDVAGLIALDNRLEQYNRIDWQALNAEDPQRAQALWFERQQLIESRTSKQQHISQAQHQALALQQQQTAKQLQEGVAQLVKDGWTKETAAEVRAYGLKTGFSEQDMASLISPLVAHTLRKAMLYDQLMAKQAKPAAKPAAASAKPVTTIKGKTGGAAPTDPSKMTDAQFAAFRRRQIAQRRA
jgi:hypothetical protein